jgi:hypothetical protein
VLVSVERFLRERLKLTVNRKKAKWQGRGSATT